MMMDKLLERYFASRECSPRYRESLTRTVRKAMAGGVPSVAELNPLLVNMLLSNLSSLTSTTRGNIRRELLTLWRYAFDERLTEVPPLRVMRIRSAAKPPQAWSLAELGRMLTCAEEDETRVGGVSEMKVRDYMPCWVALSYDTALRFSDTLALKASQIWNGYVVSVAAKTGKPLTRPLSAYSLQRAAELAAKSPDGTLFSWFLTRRRALRVMRSFLDRHGFQGSGKYLRRSCATYIEADSPGHATRYLQHSSPALVGRHYVDESLLAVPSGPPPIRAARLEPSY